MRRSSRKSTRQFTKTVQVRTTAKMNGIYGFSLGLLLVSMAADTFALRYSDRGSRFEDAAARDEMETIGKICEYGMCASPKNYPKDAILELLNRTMGAHKSFFGDVIEPDDKDEVSVGNRGGFGRFGDNSEDLCMSQRRTVKPRLQRDVNNQMKYVVNLVDFEQIVTFETCISSNKPCYGSELLPYYYTTECVQRYNVIKLLSVAETGDNLEYGRFLIPSTCVCAYIR